VTPVLSKANGLPEFSAFAPAHVLSRRVAATEQAFIEIEPPPGFAAAYDRAGQFCKIRIGGHEGVFAMFSAPNERPLSFLVRVGNPDHGEAADALAASTPHAPIEMTLPAGHGFALERARGRDVLFVATGTGIAPVRAAIESVLAERAAYGALTLDHGLRSLGHLAIAPDVERWRALDMSVHVHLSTPEPGGVHGVTVQDALRARRPDLSNAAVVAVGQAEMLASLREDVRSLGGDPELFLVNV
jgi:NAD(P)H-flavin reductase